jgi:DNA invertase Pin-like site-specific DNA recombinase
MHERAAAARGAARRRGRHTGRPPKLTAGQVRQVRSLREGGESISELVASYGVSRATIYRALRDSGPPSPPARQPALAHAGAV